MSTDGSRRFTDREVALVLQKASELEEAEVTASGRGLSLADLHEIAREVGISATAVDRAVAKLGRPGRRHAGVPLVRRAMHVVDARLGEEALARLVHLVDERADAAGTVAEALGSIRWTSGNRLKSTQVSLTPQEGETVIQVVEKIEPHLRPLFHAIPGLWGAMIAIGAVAPFVADSGGLAAAIGGLVVVAGGIAGAAAGRLGLRWVSGRSARRVERLAAGLAEAAREEAERVERAVEG